MTDVDANLDPVSPETKYRPSADVDAETEALAREFHEVYQAEAKRQGDVRHPDDYDDLAENVKDFDRVLARHVLTRLRVAEEERDAWRVNAEKVLSQRDRLRAENARHG